MGRRVALMLVTRASASAPIPIIRSNADVFDTIYKHRGWGGDGVEASLSGSGSSLANTKRLCGLLGQLVHEASQNATVVTFLDAPMGDWFWMSRCLPSMARNLRNGGRLVYQGVDVSATALAHADRRRDFVAAVVARLPGNRTVTLPPFVQIDLARPGVFLRTPAKLSHKSYDIVMCMDALMHLPIPMVAAALWNLNTVGKPGGTFVTNQDTRHRDRNFNKPINPGQWRPLDVTMPPLNLPGRLRSVKSSTFAEKDDTFGFPLNVSGLPLDGEARRVAEAQQASSESAIAPPAVGGVG